MRTLWHDLRYGVRMLRKSPGFTAVAVLALALGIGVNTAIFSGVSAFVLRPLPGVGDPDRLSLVFETTRGGEPTSEFSYPDYIDFRDRSGDVLEGLAAHDMVQAALGEGNERDGEVVWGEIVSGNIFDVLKVRMHLGRGFLPEEDRTQSTHPVVVLSHALWQNRFGSDPAIVNKTVQLNGKPYTVVGVASEEFTGAKWAIGMNFWVPLMMREQLAGGSREWYTARGNHSLDVMARLRAGVTREQAAGALDAIARRLEEAYPDARTKDARMLVVPEPEGRWEELGGVVRLSSGMALAVVGLILLIACANVANLLLARAVSRRREIGIRLALGAGRARIVRQLLTESVLLSLLGGGLGLLLAFWITDLMTGFFPAIAYTITLKLAPDTRALLFTLAVSLLTGLVFGLAPALQASRPDLVPILKGETSQRQQGRVSRFGVRGALVVAQVALSLVVLVCAAMFVKSFRNAKTIDPGFATENVLTASLNPGLMGYEREQGKEFYRQLVERVEALPGVEAAGLANWLPLGDSSSSWGPVYSADQPVPEPGQGIDAHVASVTPGLFDAMQIPLLKGRDFEERDRAGVLPEAVIVNETLARRLWPNEEAVGKRLTVGRSEPETLEVVGVVRDAKYRSLGETPRNHIYVSLDQTYRAAMSLVVRGKGDPASYAGALRGAVKSIDPRMPLYNVKTMRQHLTWALWAQNMAASLSTAFGILALVLAATGLYSVIAYSVSQRTREIGIRMALGAQPRDVLRMIARQGLALALAGVGAGLLAALLLTRVIGSLLYGVGATDLTIFIGVPLLLAAVALVATYLPARRATKVDPMVALRYE